MCSSYIGTATLSYTGKLLVRGTRLYTDTALSLPVLHVYYNVEVFIRHFPSLEPKPAAIFMGGGFDSVEFDIARSVPGASSIPWFRPLPFKPGNEHLIGKEAPPAHVVASAARKAIDEHVDVLKTGQGAGEIWYY